MISPVSLCWLALESSKDPSSFFVVDNVSASQTNLLNSISSMSSHFALVFLYILDDFLKSRYETVSSH